MRKLLLVTSLVLTPTLSIAQQAPERIAQQIGQLVIQIETQRDQITILQKQLAEKDAKIKELEGKEKPKVDNKN